MNPRRDREPEPERRAPDDDPFGIVALPGFEDGGRVERTGIALVHEGEWIMPAPGSEAQIGPLPHGTAAQVITYHFPIEVEVIGQLGEQHRQEIARHVYEELDAALRAQV